MRCTAENLLRLDLREPNPLPPARRIFDQQRAQHGGVAGQRIEAVMRIVD